jgi:phosphoglycolate phosphatase
VTDTTPSPFDGVWQTPKLILWDWNGTLLNDVDYAIGVRNRVFPRFGLPPVKDIAEYHAQFTFPVKLYYLRAGVTEENFNAVANAWMDEYLRGCDNVPLFTDAVAALNLFSQAGLMQTVLSASKLDTLTMQLRLAGILERFDDVLGLSHIYATSKAEIGQKYLAQSGVNPRSCVMLGDTLHDAEVAEATCCRCVLIARGHQSRKVLESAAVPVCDTLTEAVALVLGRKTPDR